MGRVWTSTQTTGGVQYGPFSYGYDLSGALASETYPSGLTVTDGNFDAAGRLHQVTGNMGVNYASGVAWIPQGIGVLTLGNGVTENWSYGSMQKQPTQLALGNLAGGSALTLSWGYGSDTTNNGTIVSATIDATPPVGTALAATQAFSYDPVNRQDGHGGQRLAAGLRVRPVRQPGRAGRNGTTSQIRSLTVAVGCCRSAWSTEPRPSGSGHTSPYLRTGVLSVIWLPPGRDFIPAALQ